MMHDVTIPSGKVTVNIAMLKLYVSQGKRVAFMTLDTRKTIEMLTPYFKPGTLFELIENGVIIHEKRSI